MKFLLRAFGLIVLGSLTVALFVRFAPVTPADWHVDPLTVERPDTENFHLLRPEDGDGPAPVFKSTPEAVAVALRKIISETPRASLVAGSPENGHMTVVVRSRLMGFPDFVTIKLLAVDGGTALAIFSRSRYGYSDMGVNKARVERWLEALRVRLER